MKANVIQILIGVSMVAAIVFVRNQNVQNPGDFSHFVRGPSSVQTRNDAAILNGFLEKVENSWEVGKNHERVKTAFHGVVRDARQSTVLVFSNRKQVAMGTVVDANGFILTKASEVEGQRRLSCRLFGGISVSAEIVGVLDRHDLALLKVARTNLIPIDLANTNSSHRIGTLVATPSTGKTPIAIGILGSQPKEIQSDGILGIRMEPTRSGPRIVEVIDSSAAKVVGIRKDDIVTKVNGNEVSHVTEVVKTIGLFLPGDRVRVEVRRGEQQIEFQPKLIRYAELDEDNGDFQSYLGGQLSDRRSGFPTVIQHDTFLLPEHCGGPLADLQGNVIGINIARAERIASYALPMDVVQEAVAKLIAGTNVNVASKN